MIAFDSRTHIRRAILPKKSLRLPRMYSKVCSFSHVLCRAFILLISFSRFARRPVRIEGGTAEPSGPFEREDGREGDQPDVVDVHDNVPGREPDMGFEGLDFDNQVEEEADAHGNDSEDGKEDEDSEDSEDDEEDEDSEDDDEDDEDSEDDDDDEELEELRRAAANIGARRSVSPADGVVQGGVRRVYHGKLTGPFIFS